VAAAGGRKLRVAHAASFAFDSSWEPLIWLLDGHALCVIDDYRHPAATLAAVSDHRLDVLDVTPTYLAELEHLGLLDDGVRPAVLLVGGEPTPPDVWARLSSLPGTLVRDLYGPTETTVDAYGWVPDGLGGRARAPIANTATYVLDRFLQPTPPGVVGELYVGGAGLARGYLNQAALTAERFVADPFGSPGGRLYRTGDRARWNRSGVLEFLGRVDDQVKIRGLRIEPGEIEAALAAHPAVSAAAVTVREDQPGQRRLVGYAASTDADPAELRAWLAERLPGYMVPAVLVVLDALPLTANNKIDKAAFPVPEFDRGAGRRPSSPAEQILAGLFAEVLGVEGVGADDDFFALGGHSLLAARLIGRARAVLGTELPLRAVFDTPTVAGLAGHLEGRPSEGRALAERSGRPPLRPMAVPESGRWPLSAAQARLWFLYQLEGPSPTYNIPLAWALDGSSDVAALEAALADLVERHETLRTVFPDFDGIPFQRVLSAGPVPLARIACEQDAAEALLEELAAHPFDLRDEPPIRATLVRIGADGLVLSLVVHHIASDEASDEPLFADFERAYTARREGRTPDWEPLSVTYRDYALWQRDLLGDPADPQTLAGRQATFWRETLAGLPDELVLPSDRPRLPVPSFEGDTVSVDLPRRVVGELVALARDTGTTPFMVVQAAVAALLSRLGSGDDVPLGVPTAGRDEPALEALVGFFVNTLVLRTDTSGYPTFRQLLERVREVDLAAFAHGDLPFDLIVEAVNPSRTAARHPLFLVLVSYQHSDGFSAEGRGDMEA
ncbi:MAG: condensation domain-containing protein, partial [Acidimicrobiales bacterium]